MTDLVTYRYDRYMMSSAADTMYGTSACSTFQLVWCRTKRAYTKLATKYTKKMSTRISGIATTP